MGPIPHRIGFDGRLPVSWSDGSCRWDRWYAPDEYPKCCAANIDFIWNANNRMVGGTELAKLGDGGYDIGARAHQIRDDLRRLGSATPKDMLDIQLDDRAVFLERWHNQLLSTCRSLGPSRMATELNFVAAWGTGRVAPMWILSAIGWSGHIEKRLLAEYLSLFLMLPEGSTLVFLTVFSSSRTHFGAR